LKAARYWLALGVVACAAAFAGPPPSQPAPPPPDPARAATPAVDASGVATPGVATPGVATPATGATAASSPSRPSEKVKARAMRSLIGAVGDRPNSNCSTSCGNAATALRNSSIMPGVLVRVLSMMRFSRFSIDQPNSAIGLAPTILPLPFNVWKLRRSTPSDSKSMGFRSHIGKNCWIDAISSLASSMNSSTNCGSTPAGSAGENNG